MEKTFFPKDDKTYNKNCRVFSLQEKKDFYNVYGVRDSFEMLIKIEKSSLLLGREEAQFFLDNVSKIYREVI